MKSFFYLSLLLAVIASDYALAATFGSGNYSNPDYPGKCLIRPDLILSPGEYQYPSPNCGRTLCSSNGMATFHFCGAQWTNVPGCNLGDYADVSANYPECCKRLLSCPNNLNFDGEVAEF